MSNKCISESYDLHPKWEEFLLLLKKSFSFLAEVQLKDAPSAMEITNWGDIFKKSDCSLVWANWYDDHGKFFLAKIDGCSGLLEKFDPAALKQAIYTLDEVNQSGDYEYILDMTADTIGWLENRAERLMRRLEELSSCASVYVHGAVDGILEVKIDPTSSSGTRSFA
ncbi:MAG: hypothetical protein E7200_11530 [Selenomonas ruminantium]|nr:hypothetical protein [Selenomonas ruminantium]